MKKSLKDLINNIDNKNWVEDFSLENGNYESTCIACGSSFLGHKDKFTCKVCYLDNIEKGKP